MALDGMESTQRRARDPIAGKSLRAMAIGGGGLSKEELFEIEAQKVMKWNRPYVPKGHGEKRT